MMLQKTEKARDELRGGLRRLGRRERNLLILADGQKTMQDLESMLKEETQALATFLISEGYLTNVSLMAPQPTRPSVKPSARHQVAGGSASGVTAIVPPVSVDLFEGKRSLATTRMFLFDICERMFVRRAPEQAQAFRDALRHARDRESMLVVARDIMEAVEQSAGADRANSISQRIAMILPVED